MKRPCLHLICNAHLDPVWQWRWEEGCAEALSTFRNAVQLLGENDQLIFNHNEAVLYRWIMEYDSALFRKIQALVREGRWFISGGWYLQPDVNIPDVESIIRHVIEGRRFFFEQFGVQPKVAYNFDSFGHSAGLPQVLSQAGYKMYIHMRPQHPDLILPCDLFRWRGADGSEVIGLRIAVGLYHTEYDNIEQRLAEGVDLALKINRDIPVFWGIGDHGGGATRKDLARIESFIRTEDRIDIVHSTPDRFYEAVKDVAEMAPIIEGDLQRVFTGCYTSLSRIKRQARKSLSRLVQTETLRAATWWTLGQEYPQDELDDAWRAHLFNDFHDILPGTCVEPAERDALDLYGRVAESVRRLRLGAAVAYNRGPRRDFEIPVTVLNTNPACTRVPVEIECMISHRPKWTGLWHLRLFESDGTEVSCQEEQPEALLPYNGWRRKICFMADLPAIGAKNYYVGVVAGSRKGRDAEPTLRYEIDRNSGLVFKLSADDERECLSGPMCRPLVVKDDGDSWGTDVWKYREVVGEFAPDCKSIKTIENGPIRAIHQSVHIFGNSKIVFNTIAYAQWPILEYRLRVHWNEEAKRLKLSIPTVFQGDCLRCEVPGGVMERPADGEEHVHGRWFMVSGNINGSDTALAVINSGQHGLDCQNGEVRLSVLRSPAYCHAKGLNLDEYPVCKYMDQGIHDVRFLVTVGDTQTVRRSLSGLADWLSAGPVAYAHLPIGSTAKTHTQSQQKETRSRELLRVDSENVRILTCKRSWDDNALIVRMQESNGTASKAVIWIEVPELSIALFFEPHEIKTIRIDRSGQWQEVDLVKECRSVEN